MKKMRMSILGELLVTSIFVTGSLSPISVKAADNIAAQCDAIKNNFVVESLMNTENAYFIADGEIKIPDRSHKKAEDDSSAPVITGVEDGGNYECNEITVCVTDECLEKVTCNQEKVPVKGKNAKIIVKYQEGERNTFTIEAWDKAGNKSIRKHTKDFIVAYDVLKEYNDIADIRKLAVCTKEDHEVYYILCGWMSEKDAKQFQAAIKETLNVSCFEEDVTKNTKRPCYYIDH